MRRIVLGVLVAGGLVGSAQAESWVVEARYADRAELQRAAAHFQHVIVDQRRGVFRVATSDAGVAAIEREGLAVTIDAAATAKLRAHDAQLADAFARGRSIDSIPGFECFRTVEETYQSMDTMAAGHPDIVAIDEIGPTWKKSQNPDEGYEMRALHVTNFATLAADPDRPRMVVFSSIHAREYAPAEVDTRFAEWLVGNYGSDPEATWLVDHNDFHLILMANPDARKDAEQQIYQRKNLDTINGPCSDQDSFSQPGVDLNRNFPFHWNITDGVGSSGEFCDQTFRGPTKSSEPETQNLMQYVAGACGDDGVCAGGLFADRRTGPMNPPNVGGDGNAAAPDDTAGIFFDIHSNAALILWPWGDTFDDSPNAPALQTLGRRLAYFNGYTPQQSNELYFTDGTTDDTMYGLLGVASYTIETNGSDFFEDCATFDGNTAPTNIATLRYAARALHAPYRLPSGPDTISVTAGSDLAIAGDPLAVSAALDSSRFNQSNGTEPVRTIASAAAFVDALPWDAAASGSALDAADGAFDASVETARGTIPTTGLATGRHFVYVQATDVAGNAGTPNAAFVDVADASEVGTLSGRITDHMTASPMAATVTLHNPGNGETRQATSDPATGDYLAHAFAGTFDVRVSAPYHLAETVAGVDLAAGGAVTRDFDLLPDCTIFSDDVESGSGLWSAQAPWQIVDGAGSDTTHVWNTPNYGDGLSRSLTTSTAYDLSGYSDVTVDFADRCATEAGYDFGYLEFSTNGGSTWTEAYSCSGQSTWQTHHVELPASANGATALKIRFRLQSDFFNNDLGWAVDDIRLGAGGDACRAQQPDDVIFADGFDP